MNTRILVFGFASVLAACSSATGTDSADLKQAQCDRLTPAALRNRDVVAKCGQAPENCADRPKAATQPAFKDRLPALLACLPFGVEPTSKQADGNPVNSIEVESWSGTALLSTGSVNTLTATFHAADDDHDDQPLSFNFVPNANGPGTCGLLVDGKVVPLGARIAQSTGSAPSCDQLDAGAVARQDVLEKCLIGEAPECTRAALGEDANFQKFAGPILQCAQRAAEEVLKNNHAVRLETFAVESFSSTAATSTGPRKGLLTFEITVSDDDHDRTTSTITVDPSRNCDVFSMN